MSMRFAGGADVRCLRMRSAAVSSAGTTIAMGLPRSRTVIVSPRRASRRYSRNRALSSGSVTCFMPPRYPFAVQRHPNATHMLRRCEPVVECP
jgi:hypothetical protein